MKRKQKDGYIDKAEPLVINDDDLLLFSEETDAVVWEDRIMAIQVQHKSKLGNS